MSQIARILIVDDQAAIRLTLGTLLTLRYGPRPVRT